MCSGANSPNFLHSISIEKLRTTPHLLSKVPQFDCPFSFFRSSFVFVFVFVLLSSPEKRPICGQKRKKKQKTGITFSDGAVIENGGVGGGGGGGASRRLVRPYRRRLSIEGGAAF